MSGLSWAGFGRHWAECAQGNGRYVVAFSADADRALTDGCRLLLLSYEGGRWRDVTKALLPVAFNKKLAYKLPRQGRSIEVTDEGGRRLYDLTWRNDRFIINRAARR